MEELLGCWREAQRADKVAAHLLSIRNLLGLEFHDHFSPIIREVEQCSRLLRDLYDLFPIYRSRVPIILYYLNIILPSICKRLQEMMIYLDNDGKHTIAPISDLVGNLTGQGLFIIGRVTDMEIF